MSTDTPQLQAQAPAPGERSDPAEVPHLVSGQGPEHGSGQEQGPAQSQAPAQVRWLDTDEQHAWRDYLRASRLLEAALDRDLQAHGLQLSEYEIISMLSERPNRRLRMSEIAELVVQSRSRLTHTAGRLEKRGWVRREACEGDRRGVELVLTEAGQAEIDRSAPTHVGSVRVNLLDHLSRADFLSLGRAMAAISRGIESTGVCDEVRAEAQLDELA